ncbi:hypothetical protein TKK_0019398 [Trichogramma kaykai]
MDYIIDMQGYICPDGKFLPKEIAVVSLLLHSASSWIISPPDDYLNYSAEVRKCIELYSQKVHGIQWTEGSVCGDKLLKAELRGYEFSIVYRRGRVNNNVDALSRNPTSCDTSDLTRAQLYELADKQEREDDDLSGEKDHPPGRIFTIRAKRVADGEERIDKDKYDDNSDCDSTDFFQQVTRKHRRTESPMPLVRQAKLDAKEKISDIINLDKRPRKANSHCIADNTTNAASARSPNAQEGCRDGEENMHLNANSEPHTTQKLIRRDSSPCSICTNPDVVQPQPDGTADYRHKTGARVSNITESLEDDTQHENNITNDGSPVFIRRPLKDVARDLSTRLQVDIKEGSFDGKQGLQINVWELPANAEAENECNIVRSSENCPLKLDSSPFKDYASKPSPTLPHISESSRLLDETTQIDDDQDAYVCKTFTEHCSCAAPQDTLFRSDDIPSKPRGNCLFYSLIKICDLKMSAIQLRRQLLNSPFIASCSDPVETACILSSDTEFGDIECIYVFANEYKQNVCVHFKTDTGYIYCHVVVDTNKPFIHLHLQDIHFTPYLPVKIITTSENQQAFKMRHPHSKRDIHTASSKPSNVHALAGTSQSSSMKPDTQAPVSDSANESPSETALARDKDIYENNSTHHEQTARQLLFDDPISSKQPKNTAAHTALAKYSAAKARPPKDKPPWICSENPLFDGLTIVRNHPFKFNDNLVFAMTASPHLKSEMLDALIERGYLPNGYFENKQMIVGETYEIHNTFSHMYFMIVKQHINDQCRKKDILRCLNNLKRLVNASHVANIGLARDLTFLNIREWQYISEHFNTIFKGSHIKATLYLNNLPVPPVENRFQLIKEYHESSSAGHRGINTTYNRLACDYYWRNMRQDVEAFVKRCECCQTEKLIRVKTKLPMIITDTTSRPFEKLSLDFYGPLKHSSRKNHYVLTMQDWLSKFIILTPCKKANAHEVAKALIERVICYFGPPSSILTDNGTHFQNNLLRDLANIFKITKLRSCVYRPQTQGAIERMHHTLTEYSKKYTNETMQWDDCLSLAQHAYNTTQHESTGFSPIEVLLGFKARTPTSFAPPKDYYAYDDYIKDTITELSHVQTLAAMNLQQAKHRSKHYYDTKLNVKHFREGEMIYLLKEPQVGKFYTDYTGPFEIIEINNETKNVKLMCDGIEKLVHVDKIKRAVEVTHESFKGNEYESTLCN